MLLFKYFFVLFFKFFNEINDFLSLHHQFELEPKLGSDDLVKPFRTKLINDIDNKFAVFNEQNDKKRENLEVSLKNSRYYKRISESRNLGNSEESLNGFHSLL